jgi:pSer/pThr/pTyr-binding forkhead associated (FHA) protein
VILRVIEATDAVVFRPTKPTVLGRVSPSNPRKPDIDLRDYRAYEKGVSCYHATIYVYENDLVIADLGSTNGTFLNGERLVPHQRHVLHDGDEIRLSNLVARVYFRNAS